MIRYNGILDQWEIDFGDADWMEIDRIDALRWMEQEGVGRISEMTVLREGVK